MIISIKKNYNGSRDARECNGRSIKWVKYSIYSKERRGGFNNLRAALFRVIAVVIRFDESLITFVVNWGNVRGLYYISGQLFYLWYTSYISDI